MIAYVAFAALLVNGLVSWRWSRSIAGSLALAFVSTLVYLVHPFEAQRWVSAVVGLAGALEASAAAARAVRAAKTPQEAIAAFERRGWLGMLCLCSMGMDAVAMLSWRAASVWPMPITQIAVSSIHLVVGLWPARRSS